MLLLQKLTPAESLLLRKGDLASGKNAMKYTFLDLLLKDVLTLHTFERPPDSSDFTNPLRYVMAGRNFGGHAVMGHEMSWLHPFLENPKTILLFRHAVQIAMEYYGSENRIVKSILKSPNLNGAFSRSWVQKILRTGFDYTDHGIDLRVALEEEIRMLEQRLPAMLGKDRNETLRSLRVIGGNLFLLEGLNIDVWRDIERELVQELDRRNGNDGGSVFTFQIYDDEFDEAAPSEANGDSGCSSDSGCGGCGGCGGD